MLGRTLRRSNWSRVRGRLCAPPLSRASTAPATQPSQFPDVMHPTRTGSTTVKGTVIEGRPVYLDNQATTALDPRVLDAMMPFQTEQFGNPHSRTHMFGWETEDYVEHARAQVAKLINADPKEIIFTSGATESNNIAIKGIARYSKKNKEKKHVITVQTEHKCVLDSTRQLQLDEGFDATFLPVQNNGLIDLEVLKKEIRPDTALISVMMVNNEIGVQQPIKEIGEIAKAHGIPFHVDAAQAVGKIPVDVKALGIAAMSISGHKIYGPKGVGALYVRRRPRLRMQALFSGGGQERGLRSGTLPAPLCVGLGAACEIAQECMEEDTAHVTALADRLMAGIRKELSHVQLNGDSPGRYPGNVNLSFSAVEGESLLMGMKEIAVSSGSACTSASLEPSYVLRALGVSDDMAHTSIRYGIGRFTTEEEVDFAVAQTVEHVSKLRDMSPLWEMLQEGIDPNSIQWAAQ